MSSCSETQNEIPGNIGVVKSKVLIWEHDPMYARPYQNISFPVNKSILSEVPKSKLKDVQLYSDSACLKPKTDTSEEVLLSHMFVATRHPEDGLIYVRDDIVDMYLPGGEIYEGSDAEVFGINYKNHFPHNLWIYTGSILRDGVLVHPDEYENEVSTFRTNEAYPTVDDIQNSPKWKMIVDSNDTLIMPYMSSKHIPYKNSQGNTPIHWTLEKWAPLWEGEDFIIRIVKGEKSIDTPIDPITVNKYIPLATYIDNYKEYAYYTPNPETVPRFFYPGKSNEAVTVLDEYGAVDEEQSRLKYWLEYKTYIIVEFGDVYEDEHNHYFIELIKGNNPRFLKLGKSLFAAGTKEEPFALITKSLRVLSEFTDVSCDDLFSNPKFHFTVRNHLGELIITFSGHEGNPWRITRYDYDYTHDHEAVQKEDQTPIKVQSTCKIHGGNISCGVHFAPLQYTSKSFIPMGNKQLDTKGAESENVYVLFSNMGKSEKNKGNTIYSSHRPFMFKKPGYDVDANIVSEYVHNVVKKTNLYKEFHDQYLHRTGRGLLNGNFVVSKNSELKILNIGADDYNSSFILGLHDDKDKYKYKEYVSVFNIGILMVSGDVTIPPELLHNIGEDKHGLGEIDRGFGAATFKNVLTPIVTNFRIVITGDIKPIYDNIKKPLDITDLVSNISSSWNVEEYHIMRQEMNLKCYIPVGSTENNASLFNLGRKLLSLKDKTIYLTISYWWEGGVGEKTTPGIKSLFRNFDSSADKSLIQMTGISFGGEIERSNNLLYINLHVKDYMSILEHQYIFNSPFFDAVNDAVAIYEIAQMAGFDDSIKEKDFLRGRPFTLLERRPLGYIQRMISLNNAGTETMIYNGERFYIPTYALPGSYADLSKPAVRFPNGERMLDAMKKIAQISGKTIYFDRYGVLKFERTAAAEVAFSGQGENAPPKPQVKYDFVTSPNVNLLPTGNAGGLVDHFDFDPTKDAAHLVYNVVKYKRDVESAVNQVSLYSATNKFIDDKGKRFGGYMIEGYTFFDQLFDPTSEGFFGFRKVFYQSNGLFGSERGIKKGMGHYAKMKYPPFVISFETYGVPGLKPLDVITLDNNPIYINEISHSIDPSTNSWWMNITGEWFKPYTDDLTLLGMEIQDFPPIE